MSSLCNGRDSENTHEQYRVVLHAEHANGASFMQTSQNAKPQRSSSSGHGGSGKNMAARVRTTIAPASVDIDKRSIVDVAAGRVTVVVVENNGSAKRRLHLV